jgi:quercetin dioxygenase-like cupin family protein
MMQIQRVPVSFEDGRGQIIDILRNEVVDYATIITSRKGAVRGNHFHKDTYQHLYVLDGKLRVVVQMPGEPPQEGILEQGDVIVNVPLERHAFEAMEDTTFLVLTRGPRGGENYETDTFRLDIPLIAP